jgi:DNA-binding response OmpR family regulator
LFRLGRVPVELSLIEFRIVAFLSNTPYKAYTRRQIVAAISTEKQSVDEDGLDEHIRTLRDKLGIFSDFVQSVPHIGYRFKP